MRSVESREINVAIAATPNGPVGAPSGGEIFSGHLANSLSKHGFPVRVYGQKEATYPFESGVIYRETGPTSREISSRNSGNIQRAIKEANVRIPLTLAQDIAESLEQNRQQGWVVIDNDITTTPIAPFLASSGIPHIFVQHTHMTPDAYVIYKSVVDHGGKLVAIAEHQKREISYKFGSIHDVTIKNGIPPLKDTPTPRVLLPGEEIQVGTLSRIHPTDQKGIIFAGMAVKRVREQSPARLSIAGALPDRGIYDAIIAPLVESGIAEYVGEKTGAEKSIYLSQLHAGAALSNPGKWDAQTGTFNGDFAEGYSLTLPEMMLHGVVPVSSDSGGAEPLVDAGLGKYIIPLETIRTEGIDGFVSHSAKAMLQAATSPDREELPQRVRTVDAMGEEYADYILSLFQKTK